LSTKKTGAGPNILYRMQKFMKHFKRDLPGVWTCVTAVTLSGITISPGTKVLAGTMFEGIDIAQMLEHEYAKQQQQGQG